MENENQQKAGDNAKSNQKNQSPDHTITQNASEEEFMGTPVENPASQSEAGPDIYDIGMGGPGASSSGLRDRNEDESQED